MSKHQPNHQQPPGPSKPDESFERFCLVLSQIPEGKVCSYGRVAELAGLGGPRQTCRLLRLLPANSSLPWYRVVNAQGKLADFANATKQRQLLQSEGILFTASNRIPKYYYF